jgi:tetratricopeptide (TPR) repeat protein
LIPSSVSLAESAKDPAPEEEGDFLALAELLIADGETERALQILSRVNPDDLEAGDRSLYFRLLGLVRFQDGDPAGAAAVLEKAVQLTPEHGVLWVLLAHAENGSGRYEQALDALSKSGEERHRLVSTAILETRILGKLGQLEEAFEVLREAEGRFDSAPELSRERALLFLSVGLYQSAVSEGLSYLERQPEDPVAFLTISAALRDAGLLRDAAAMLELGLLHFPVHTEMLTHLAHTYFKLEAPLAAGRLFERAWVLDGKKAYEAGEAYRVSGHAWDAMRMNSLVTDRTKRLRQRLAILLGADQFEEVTGMHADLERAGILQQDANRYSLAYAYYKAGNLSEAERLLLGIHESSWFEDAMQLRETIHTCRKTPWWCE